MRAFLASLLAELGHFPWRSTATTLWERFREDRLGLSASSLTFTTTIALVPFFTVALAVFTAFPMFNKLQAGVEAWLVQSLVPDAISRQVLGYLTQFSMKASRVGVVGLGVLLLSVLALALTIDRTLNSVWRVRQVRPLAQRILVYWSVMTLGPLLLAASLAITSYLLSASRGIVAAPAGVLALLLDVVEFVLVASALAALYRFVPNAPVRAVHAWTGAIFAAVALDVAKRLLAWYLGLVPTYSMVYGAFATLPILLVWIYTAWLVVLFGAVIAAYLPSLLMGIHRRGNGPGWPFQLALEVLQLLDAQRGAPVRGSSLEQLALALHVEPLQLEPVLRTLAGLDWVGRLHESDAQGARYVLLAQPESTPIEPLLRQLLLTESATTARLWQSAQLSSLSLRDVL